MINPSGHLLPVLNTKLPLACAECGGPANMPAQGVARVIQIGDKGWRVCIVCDRERRAWDAGGINPLADVVSIRYDAVSALSVERHGPPPYRVLMPYSGIETTAPTDEPNERWGHIDSALLERVIDRCAAARWAS